MRRVLARCLGGAVLATALAGVVLVAVPGSPLAAPPLRPAVRAEQLTPAAPFEPPAARLAAVRQEGDAVVLLLAGPRPGRLVLSPDVDLDRSWMSLRTAADAAQRPRVLLGYDAAGLVTTVRPG